MQATPPEPTLDRTVFAVTALDTADEERAWWAARSPAERLRHIQYLRWVNYGDAASGRLQRVLEVAELT